MYRTTDGTFSSPDTSSELRLGDQMYFKLEMNTIRDDLKIVPQTCYATNSKDSSLKYYLVEDGYGSDYFPLVFFTYYPLG